ncbi:beta strand repeat-containing protein [Cellulomonas oligotrophica]|uniref:Putative repeat protein (TIGR01451 family) n=1 Tax=Cellulomonas oligotrophica TaxID=931536 RepID=A0A7Y9FF53_9CELL|nr:Ig-like domain-containing protein [Cellulomonas oligotrophica]NYD86155.1 putative repeat protein (TIGR01451 family) [Cellulomonas oligotrophica]GIG34333.1 hypothetical protein Col01nite_34920 [Cellulomonas oligotrophica]
MLHAVLRRARAVAVLLVGTAVLGGVLAAPAQAANIDPFAPVFSANAHGTIVMAANTLMTCSAAGVNASTCEPARTSPDTSIASTYRNNNYTGAFVDVVADGATTFSSSSSTLTVPDGGSVLFAALVWGGRVDTVQSGTADPALRDRAWLAVDSATGTDRGGATITADHFAQAGTASGYQAYADVTDVVTAAGSGTYTVGNVQSSTGGTNQFAGWSLVVVVADPAEPMRNLSVFRGYSEISNSAGNNDVSFDVSGFLTPPSGTVLTTLGAVTYEGDRGLSGDRFSLNGTHLSDPLNPETDVFNSTISNRGTRVSAGQNPDYANQLGFDSDLVAADGILGNGATSATLSATTSSEQYWIGMVTFATELYEPNVHGAKSFSSNSVRQNPDLRAGDELTYAVVVENDGLDAATGTAFFDAVPTGTTYVPGSLELDGTALTDAADGDAGRFDPGTGTPGSVRVDVGDVDVLADGGASHVVSFTVVVDDDVVAGQNLVNAAQTTSRGATTGTVAGTVTNIVQAVVEGDTGDAPPVLRDHVVAHTPTAATPSVTVDVLAGAVDTGGAVTLVGTTQPAHGTLAVDPAGTVVYTPATDFAGRDVLTYTATDSAGNLSTATVIVEVVNGAPTAQDDALTLDVDVPVSAATTVDVLGNDTDPSGDTLTVRSITVDGFTTTGGSLTTAGGGTVTLSGGTITYAKPVGGLGAGRTEVFDYTVQDSRGASDVGEVTITSAQVNSAPVAVDDTADAVAGAGPVAIDVAANDTDADGDSLAASAAGTPVDSDGTTRGTTAVGTDGRVVYTPAAGWGGTVTFPYTVTDPAGATSDATVTVTVDAPPTGVADTATTASGTPVDVDVLANDSDLDGDPLELLQVDDTGAVGTAVVVTTDDGPRVRYTPAAGFVGDDTVTSTVGDGRGGTTDVILTVTVANAAPVAQPDTAGTTVGVPLTGIDVLGNDTDANVDAGYGDQELTVTAATADQDATVTVNPDGTLDVTPLGAFVGTVTVTYTLSDGVTTTTGTLTVTVSNGAPATTADTATTPTSTTVVVDVLANDTDPDGETLVVASGSLTPPVDADGTPRGTVEIVRGGVQYTPTAGWTGTVTFGYAASDEHESTPGTVTVTVTNAVPTADATTARTASGTPVTVDVLAHAADPNAAAGFQTLRVTSATSDHGARATVGTDGRITVTPARGWAGPLTVTYVVSDGLATVTSTLVVTVDNAAPVAAADQVVTAPGRAVRLTLLRNDTDLNGDALTVVRVGTPVDADGRARGTVTLADGVATYTPADGFTGVVTFPYTISDGQATSTADATIAVAAAGARDGDAWVTPDDTVLVVDVVGDGEELVSVTPPAHGTAEVVDGRLVYTPAPGFVGTVEVEVVVRDADGVETTRTVQIVVTDPDAEVAAGPALAATGAQAAAGVAWATALLLIGLGLVLAARRRRA